MWRASYGKEPFDLRLTVLRGIKKFPVLAVLVFALTALFSGAYLVKNVLLRPARTYLATSTYKVEFVSESWAQYGTYINETTWNTWVHTEEFWNAVQKHLAQENGPAVTRQELDDALSARLASDLRIPSTLVVTEDPVRSEQIAAAVEAAMVSEFAEGVSDDIASIRVIDSGVAKEVLWDVRPKRAVVLSAVIAVLLVFGVFFLREIGDDSIWLPATLLSRYGIRPAGTLHSTDLKANLEYLFRDCPQIALCPASEEIDPAAAVEALQKLTEMSFMAVPSPLGTPKSLEALRGADGVLLVVSAGDGKGKPLEYVLELLQKQDIEVTAGLLWEADEALIRRYYRFPKA